MAESLIAVLGLCVHTVLHKIANVKNCFSIHLIPEIFPAASIYP